MTREPEEIVEAALLDVLSTACLDAQANPLAAVIGALSPVSQGAVKAAHDSFISVFVDLTDQPLDWLNDYIPLVFSARVVVHFATADEPSGEGFRDLCRRVRFALNPLLGDGCSTLNTADFSCDLFKIESTSTALDTDVESGGMTKTYNVSIAGRVICNNKNESEV